MPSAVGSKSVTRSEILEMMSEKEKLEQQLKTHIDVLQSHRVGMDDPLVDEQDFPRNDIDVYQIRLTRNQIICIRNDLKAIMDRIEKSLNAYFTQGNGNESDMVNGHCSLKPDH
ncbi:26S proteasome non-ATPase regulatory subunit 9 [Daktulosphaira vitifoliae]|uniref:26S proteasome non-ATPase regulatory subunit 9 n=1 Tax=Daktulosphaira vitifoliae TaxID=58002 RepID=UPI0021AA5DB6|nr:26S proteasome non-ATPase regulatory subunit 9 [Daktulosphaira vitifoliae]